MPFAFRLPAWASKKLDRSPTVIRASAFRSSLLVLIVLMVLLIVVFKGSHSLPSIPAGGVILARGDDPFAHFAGSKECGIAQSDIYLVPSPSKKSKASPFCKDRKTLLEALSTGSRGSFDEPFVGKGCTYKWYSTQEICMIFERFNAITFVGDNTAQDIYTALNVLLREDLALGGMQQWLMNDEERVDCKCDRQFHDAEDEDEIDCLDYTISNQTKGVAVCNRTRHAYFAAAYTPTDSDVQDAFKNLTYGQPNPWQPSPMIVSFGPDLTVAQQSQAIDEWSALAIGAERNIPKLFLGPEAHPLDFNEMGVMGTVETGYALRFQKDIAAIAKQRRFEVLRTYNLTVEASSKYGGTYGEKVALVKAMMVIDWLSKLETS